MYKYTVHVYDQTIDRYDLYWNPLPNSLYHLIFKITKKVGDLTKINCTINWSCEICCEIINHASSLKRSVCVPRTDVPNWLFQI